VIESFVSKVVAAVVNPVSDKMPIGKISDVVSKEPIKAEPPLLEYEKLRGRPYTAEHLDIDWNKKNPVTFEKNHKIVTEIEDYVVDEIKRRGWQPTLESYKDIMDVIKSAVNIDKHTDKSTEIDRLLIYIKTMNQKHKYDKKIKDAMENLHKTLGETNGQTQSDRFN
jgi:hypothetical protein